MVWVEKGLRELAALKVQKKNTEHERTLLVLDDDSSLKRHIFLVCLKVQEAVAYVMAQNRRNTSSKTFVSGYNQTI